MGDARTLDLVVNAETEAARQQLKDLADVTGQTADKVDAGLARIEDAISNLGKGGSLLAGFVGGLGAGVVEHIGEIGHAFVEASERALEYAGNLQKVADRTGASTDFLQAFRYAAQQNDVTTAKADDGLQQFNRTVGLAAEGNLKASNTFKGLNVDIYNADGTLKPLKENFLATADAISKVVSPSEQAARAQALMKESGIDLLPLLRQGAAGFDEYAAAAHRLGLILTPEQIANAAEAEQKFRDIKEQLSVDFAQAITANADALLHLAEAFKSVAEEAGAGLGRVRDYYGAISRGASVVYNRAGGGAAGAAAVAGTSFGDLQVAGMLNDPKHQQAADLAALNAAPRGSVLRQQLQADYEKTYPQAPAKTTGGALPVDDRAQGVLDRLNAKVDTGGDPRALAVASALSEAGVTADSAIGQKIAAAAGTNYDQTGGKRAAEAAAKRDAAAKKKAADQAAAADRDVVTARRAFDAAETDAADTPEARYDLASQKVDDKYSDALTTIGGKEATGKLSKAQADDERWMAAMVAADEQIVLDKNEQARKVAEQLTALETDIGLQKDELTARLALADTAAQRRVIQLKLLDLELQEERAQQQAVIDSDKSTPAQVADARKKLAGIDATAADKREAINRGTDDPLQAYQRQVNLTADQINEAFKGVEADGLKGLNDGLTGIITGTESVATAFTKMAQSIISDLARILIEKAIVGPLANVLTGTSPASAGGLIGAIFGGGFADGGVPPAGKISLVGENGPELIVGNGNARVIPFAPASPRSATTGSAGGGTMINVDARGASDPAEIDRRVRAGIIAAVPALHAGIRDSTIATLKRPMLPGGRS